MTAAVKAAPVPALTAAMIAKVVFDILKVPSEGWGVIGLECLLYWHLEEVQERGDNVRCEWYKSAEESIRKTEQEE